MSQIAQFNAEELNNAIVEFVPACVQVVGKTSTEKRLSVIHVADNSVKLYASGMKGKVGTAARSGLQEEGFRRMCAAASTGNYTPLAQALALTLGENVYLKSRAAYETYGDVLEARMDQLEDNDKKWNKSGDKLTSAYAALTSALMLLESVKQGVAAIRAHRAGETTSDAE